MVDYRANTNFNGVRKLTPGVVKNLGLALYSIFLHMLPKKHHCCSMLSRGSRTVLELSYLGGVDFEPRVLEFV